MRSRVSDVLEKCRVNDGTAEELRWLPIGHFFIKVPGASGVVLELRASNGEKIPEELAQGFLGRSDGWEHVSVSVGPRAGKVGRCPTWEEMVFVKRLFWTDEETVIQYHPPEAAYIHDRGHNPYILHLWRHATIPVLVPPGILV